ncbi:LuxR C-terminal-related transcriptional regulator [Nitriliruptor alkaliphilus]|uniref:LuxR C-terminal-related transcriptional regulator n=1 Tax=Nitriliruptor alkaliphilus TaxID=427918 RepID=UPI000695A4DE|nr:LuxR C-terminal-related transcriptional regulator [Nitriliruptor alkaliphilus]
MLQRARDAYARRDWLTAREAFTRARPVDVGADDVYALSNCHWWLGDVAAALPLQREAFERYLADEQPDAAALVALDIGYTLSLRGDGAQASGWLGRARGLLEGLPEGPVHGYLLHVAFEEAFEARDLGAALETAERVHALGVRLRDAGVTALGLLGKGRVLVRRGQVAAGMPCLDQAMLVAVSDDLDPAWAGNIYCHLIAACYEIGDLRRAGEWTEETARWCEAMPGSGPFLGICRVHRAQIMQVRGAWDEAEREATLVTRELTELDLPIVAEAHYLLGELGRQRGDASAAEAAFREGHRLGRDPQPGLALLRLALGDVEAAAASIRTGLTAAGEDPLGRARLLPAAVEIALAEGDLDQAHAWSDELSGAADRYGTSSFQLAALHARGSVLLASGDARTAAPVLRDALRTGRLVDAPYDLARTRLLLADVYRSLGDEASAALERETAESTFGKLGVRRTANRDRDRSPAGLTSREAEVLSLVATGRSNQQIAAELVLSVRTIERHLSTVYQKLGLQGRSARAAAVAYALREGAGRRP